MNHHPSPTRRGRRSVSTALLTLLVAATTVTFAPSPGGTRHAQAAPAAPTGVLQAGPAGTTTTTTIMVPAGTAADPQAVTQETVTVHTLTTTEIAVLARKSGTAPLAGGLAGTNRCWAMRISYGAAGLRGYGSQTWCGRNGFITYYPPADCWGTSSWPTYEYLGCSTNQVYGFGWNQGRSTFHWDLCPGWVPVWGSCARHDYHSETWYFTPAGQYWKL